MTETGPVDEFDRSLLNIRKVLALRVLGCQAVDDLGQSLETPHPEQAYEAIADRVAAKRVRKGEASTGAANGATHMHPTSPVKPDRNERTSDGGLTHVERLGQQRPAAARGSPALRWLVIAGLMGSIIALVVLALR